jgi:hypothetical protein
VRRRPAQVDEYIRLRMVIAYFVEQTTGIPVAPDGALGVSVAAQ